MKVTDRIQLLLNRYGNKSITSAEFDELMIWMAGLDEEQSTELENVYQSLWEDAKKNRFNIEHMVDWEGMLGRVMESTGPEENKKIVYRMWWRVAAAIVFLLGVIITYQLVRPKSNQSPVANKEQSIRLPENVLPNINQTVLTVSNGRKIFLDSVASGNFLTEDNIKMIKLKGDEIAYSNDIESIEPEYHTISVPRGGRPYKVLLADGSKVWLNAESSLRYPSFFKGESRSVELTGEGYFEIAPQVSGDRTAPTHSSPGGKNKIPFFVKLSCMTVEVLGTHFNIMSYKDEQNIETTLLEGSVKITTGNNSTLLTPGKQAQLSANGNLNVINADTALATAWVNGYFHFNQADIKTVLRQVGRWYDLDVVYSNNMPDDLFSGKLERSLPLSGILKLFASSPIKVRVEDKKLIVLPGSIEK